MAQQHEIDEYDTEDAQRREEVDRRLTYLEAQVKVLQERATLEDTRRDA